ncbi:MAG TPA: GNAT family N-acetyltransferase [Thermoanaerobaculia bacterium]|jgi:ribosomal protein S18 acetylase RimI-like enzyme|nr:GNAT family N-acetyltransferase [Thermoanaerobaculia bacterium]
MPSTSAPTILTYRDEPRAADLRRIREIVEATGFFNAEESAVAVELADDRLAKGPASHYRFLFAEEGGQLLGYTAFGPIALTRGSWDLYWIAVDPVTQGRGIGRALLAETERRIAHAGGLRLFVETSSRRQYEPTRAFYASSGYRVAATLEDFYAPGDGKMIYVKLVAPSAPTALPT